jgi:hypothetical protein
MAYPGAARIELPILEELIATGGREDVRYLYERLVAYFPQLEDEEVRAIRNGHRSGWRRLVQRAGRSLDDRREIERRHGQWSITTAGRKRASAEGQPVSFTPLPEPQSPAPLSHTDIQRMLLDIGRVLGYHAESEFEYYDVVWRASQSSPRLSHVFEVQHKGNMDAALAKLKRAYEAQRSRPYLVITSESDTRRALRSMNVARTGAFHEIESATTILSFEQLNRLHRALTSVEDLLRELFER